VIAAVVNPLLQRKVVAQVDDGPTNVAVAVPSLAVADVALVAVAVTPTVHPTGAGGGQGRKPPLPLGTAGVYATP
tara:strand:+ start:196 stop:420 length:225 start_codon:yes stop_codon:yes gene_type:complete